MGKLEDGDVIGQMVPLEDQVCSATAKALIPFTLLRLTRKDILELASRTLK